MTTADEDIAMNEDMRAVSPLQSVKRNRTDDSEEEEQEPIRRVVQRTDESTVTFQDGTNAVDKDSIRKIIVEDLWNKDLKVKKEAMVDLLEHTNDNDEDKHAEKQKQFFSLGGPLAVVKVMSWHPNCKTIQEFGTKNLVSATYKNTDLKIAIADVGGIEAIVHAMLRFPTCKAITFSGLKALSNLAIHSDNATVLVNDTESGLPMVVERLVHFKDDYDIALWACRVIHKVCTVEAAFETLIQANTLSALSSALEIHMACPKIKKIATCTIASLVDYLQQQSDEQQQEDTQAE